MATAARLVIKGNGQSDYKSPLIIVINTYIKKQNKLITFFFLLVLLLGATTSFFERFCLLAYFVPFTPILDAFCPVIYFRKY